MSRARIYIRRSDDDQSAWSPEAQRRECEAWALRMGHEVVAAPYEDDGISGKVEQRPALQALLKDARADRGSLVIVHKFDRLARDTEALLRLVYKVLQPSGVRVASVSEGIDPYEPLGKMMLTVSGGVSTYYVDNLAREVRKGLREKWEQGRVVGNAPYGYTRRFAVDAGGLRVAGSDTLEPNEDAAVVRLIYTYYAAGNHSAAALAELLNADGYTMQVRGGGRGPFTQDGVRHILTCPTYAGLAVYKGETRPGTHPAIVEPELWARAQELRARRADGRVGKSAAKTQSLLSELAHCGGCGSKLHYHPSGGGTYYRCATVRQRGRDACGAPMVRLDAIEPMIRRLLGALVIPPDIAADAIRTAETLLAAKQAAPTVDAEQARERLRRLHRAYVAGGMDDAEYDTERRRLEALLVEAPAPAAVGVDLARAAEVLRTMGALYDAASTPERRSILLGLMDALWLRGPEIVAWKPKAAYAILVEAQAANGEIRLRVDLGPNFPMPPRWRQFGVSLF